MTQKELKRYLEYDKESGKFYWKVSNNNRVKVGDEAGYISKRNGYKQIKINKRLYLAHRLVWLYVYGEFPAKEIDHIDNNRTNNATSNLREVTRSVNARNTKVRSNSYSGVTGVNWDKNAFKWRVMVHDLEGKAVHIGYYSDFGEARFARKQAEIEFDYHPNHGEV